MNDVKVVELAEEWRDVPGLEGRYQVSNCGRVKRLEYKVAAKGGFKVIAPMMMKISINRHGYPQLSICIRKQRTNYSVHQLVAWAFIGPQQPLIEVNHIDGVKTNNRVSNLEYVTRSGNAQHAHALGLVNNNRRSAACKLSDDEIIEIRRLYTIGVRPWQIAKIFDYDINCAKRIGEGKMYAWVK